MKFDAARSKESAAQLPTALLAVRSNLRESVMPTQNRLAGSTANRSSGHAQGHVRQQHCTSQGVSQAGRRRLPMLMSRSPVESHGSMRGWNCAPQRTPCSRAHMSEVSRKEEGGKVRKRARSQCFVCICRRAGRVAGP